MFQKNWGVIGHGTQILPSTPSTSIYQEWLIITLFQHITYFTKNRPLQVIIQWFLALANLHNLTLKIKG